MFNKSRRFSKKLHPSGSSQTMKIMMMIMRIIIIIIIIKTSVAFVNAGSYVINGDTGVLYVTLTARIGLNFTFGRDDISGK